ncbi:anhydro-N-acetylmuramic acid kinase [Limnohabitans planktonicus]|uniref:Anhydro-N-acetylmuramic acid kinase n=1 Tax=Limnohabitans planktonicus II-D5 TaxID=1293045 RepID=A0A2T7UB75_9BURK|nr:anhydro-N-acetylmuramic acid kinase [Limnohabitans planktonicus]PVE41923.1 anhydro-N-acetylmuramic acid kinase [Limnohabitans planktonicus II-D5]|eukprot:gene4693-4594_t
MTSSHYIGLMSGTSLDGVDGVLARLDEHGRIQVLDHAFEPFDASFRAALLQLNQRGDDELHLGALAGNQIARHYAQVVHVLLNKSALTSEHITAIGAHGQTVRHRPLEFDANPALHQAAVGYTLQLNNPSLLAELTGIDVVADFRSRDLAAGGQGAPLVPAFHHGLFAQPDACVAVLNIGGISNLSVLSPDGDVLGWDCGPGNALMDYWCNTHTGQAFDRNGAWAASGQRDPELLYSLYQEPFLHRQPPKSTGRDLFNPVWLAQHLQPFPDVSAVDVQATLCTFTALACSQDILHFAPEARTLIVCGGGALNGQLMRELSEHLPGVDVVNSEHHGLPPLQVEAAAFAWLAFKTMRRETSSLPNVTGARGARVLGAIYPR